MAGREENTKGKERGDRMKTGSVGKIPWDEES